MSPKLPSIFRGKGKIAAKRVAFNPEACVYMLTQRFVCKQKWSERASQETAKGLTLPDGEGLPRSGLGEIKRWGEQAFGSTVV